MPSDNLSELAKKSENDIFCQKTCEYKELLSSLVRLIAYAETDEGRTHFLAAQEEANILLFNTLYLEKIRDEVEESDLPSGRKDFWLSMLTIKVLYPSEDSKQISSLEDELKTEIKDYRIEKKIVQIFWSIIVFVGVFSYVSILVLERTYYQSAPNPPQVQEKWKKN